MSRRKHEEYDDTDFGDTEPPRRKRRRRKTGRRRCWPFVLLLVIAFVFFLPNMIGWFGLQQRAIDYALADFKGKISVEKVSLGWIQSIKLTNVTATDANGNSLLKIDSVTSSRPLYALATSSDYGQFDVVNPIAYIQLRPDGSNLEDSLANYIGQPADPNAQPNSDAEAPFALPKLNVNVTDGQAMVSTTSSTQTWKIDGLNLIALVSGEEAPLIVDAQCRVTPTILDANGQSVLKSTGGLILSARADSGQKELRFNSADVLLETQNLPVSLAAPVLQRFVGPANSKGTLNGKIQASYNASSQTVALDIEQMSLSDFGFVAPELIGADQLSLDSVTASGIIQLSPKIVAAQQFNVRSDVGNLKADGSFDIAQLTNLASGSTLLDTPFQMDGEVDLARLVRMLPKTLQLHEDLEINSGTVTFQAGSQNENGIRRMVVNLDTANVSARRGAQNIDWAQPLRLVGTIRESEGQMSLEEVRCESDFLTINGSADMQTGSFVAKGDLDKLMQRIGQFADLGGTRLAGVLDGKFGWQIDPTNGSNPLDGVQGFPIQIGGSFVVANPVIEMEGMPRWQQEQMSVKLSAAGKSEPNRLQLDQGGFQIDVGNERVVATLAAPVTNAYTNQIWNANCQATGSMAGWLGHIQNFVDLGDVAASGELDLRCGATLNPQKLQLSNVEYEIQQLAFDGYAMKIREQTANGTGVVIYDLASGDVSIPETTLKGSSISARGQSLKISFPSNMQITGDVAFNADVNRVADWFELSPTQDSVFWYGSMNGTVNLVSNENGIGGRVNSTITDLIAAQQVAVPQAQAQSSAGQTIQASQPQRQWQEIWREPTVGVSGDLTLANDFNAIGFQNVAVDSPSLKVNTNGSISDLGGAMIADLSGTWQPSWEKINALLVAYTSGLLKFAGQGEQQFVVRGPIFETSTQPGTVQPWVSSGLQAAVGFGWEQGEILGLAVGKSQMEMKLNQGIADLNTNGIPFAGGVVQMDPQVDLRGESPILTLAQTRIIDNVELKPETARQWLKYVAPLAADATSAQGKFTVDVGSANVPILDPLNMNVQGAVTLSNVVFGAGPTAEQLLGTVKQIRALLKPDASDRDLNTWLKMEEQTIPVAVKDGRIFHDKVRFSHKDLTVQTSGSVGFDQTLNMVAEIPIAPDWIAGKKYLAGLAGKSITIPIGGTVSKPILDKRAIQSLSRDLVSQAATGVIDEKVGQYQEKLTGKIDAERDKIFGKLGEKLGLPAGAPAPATGTGQTPAAQPGQTGQPNLQNTLENRAKDELIKGFGNLFGK